MKLRSTIAALILGLSFVSFTAMTAKAQPREFDLVSRQLKSQYQAKKVSIPFLWLAKAAVHVVRPAGVKSFSLTLFDGLKVSAERVDAEMVATMRSAFGPEWSSIMHVRSRDGQQAYMYMREDGKNIKLAVVTIDKQQAALIKATFSPEKLAEFINDPKVFGISLSDNDNGKKQPPKKVVVTDDDSH